MEYTEVRCELHPGDDNADIAVALLSELGCESFQAADLSVSGWIQSQLLNPDDLKELQKDYPSIFVSLTYDVVPDQNWNALWESNFPIAVIDKRCVIYAPFHEDVPHRRYSICIMPQMSFGTGHHATTALMARLLLDTDLEGRSVLDMGCGTGVLAILAYKKKAFPVTAIDVDEWAFNNAKENAARNRSRKIEVLQGDASLLEGKHYDVIFANINRNVLVQDLPTYSACLHETGLLFLSGFYNEDLPIIAQQALENDLSYVRHISEDNWVAAIFKKNK